MRTETEEIKYIAFEKNDIDNNNGLIVNQLQEIKEIMLAPKRYEAFRNNALYTLLEFVTEHSEYYKKYAGFKSLNDFPVVNKEVLKNNWDDVFVGLYLNRDNLFERHTSGSTGTPFQIYWDHRKHCRMIADIKWVAELGSIHSHESTVVIGTSQGHKHGNSEKEKRDNVYGLFFPDLSNDSINQLLKEMNEIAPKALISQAALLDGIARCINDGELISPQFDMHTIFSEGQLLKDITRRTLEEFFKCKILSRYGNMECGPMAHEDGLGRGHLINEASYVIELLDLNSNEPVQDGEIGRVVVTDLYNHAFPIIRYDTGDLAIKQTYSDGKSYLSQIVGRSADMIYSTNGNPVMYANLINSWTLYQDINQVQIIQETEDTYTIVLNTRNKEYEMDIISDAKAVLGEDASVAVTYVDKIPALRSGKTQVSVCKLKR